VVHFKAIGFAGAGGGAGAGVGGGVGVGAGAGLAQLPKTRALTNRINNETQNSFFTYFPPLYESIVPIFSYECLFSLITPFHMFLLYSIGFCPT